MPIYYKFLSDGGLTHFGHIRQWPLPEGDLSGEWTPPIEGPLDPVYNGYRICTATDLPRCLDEELYVCEAAQVVVKKTIHLARRVRLLHRVHAWTPWAAAVFALNCAENALPLCEEDSLLGDAARAAVAMVRRGEPAPAVWHLLYSNEDQRSVTLNTPARKAAEAIAEASQAVQDIHDGYPLAAYHAAKRASIMARSAFGYEGNACNLEHLRQARFLHALVETEQRTTPHDG